MLPVAAGTHVVEDNLRAGLVFGAAPANVTVRPFTRSVMIKRLLKSIISGDSQTTVATRVARREKQIDVVRGRSVTTP